MKQELIRKWLDSVQPVDFQRLKNDLIKSFEAPFAGNPEIIERLRLVTDSLDESKIFDIWKTFAEEIFSDAALEAGVQFFSSEIGKKYKEERSLVLTRANTTINKYVLECMRKGGLLPP